MSIDISLNFVPYGLIEYKSAFGSDNGLVPTRRQAITWTNVDPIHWRIYEALGGDELINHFVFGYKPLHETIKHVVCQP